MRIFRGANCCDEFREVPSVKMGLRIEGGYGCRVPCARDETACPECALGGGTMGDEGEYMGYDFGGEEDLARGWLQVGRWRGRGGG